MPRTRRCIAIRNAHQAGLLAAALALAGCATAPTAPAGAAQAQSRLPEGWTRPKPACGTLPAPADIAITGTVLVSFVVHKDGRVDTIESKSPDAEPALFESVRSWLTGCAYSPARDANGNIVAGKMVIPFTFRERRVVSE